MKIYYVVLAGTVIFALLMATAFIHPYPSSWNDEKFVNFSTFIATSTAPFTILFTLFIAFKEIQHRKAERKIQDLNSAIQDTSIQIETILDKEMVVMDTEGVKEHSTLRTILFPTTQITHPNIVPKYEDNPQNPLKGYQVDLMVSCIILTKTLNQISELYSLYSNITKNNAREVTSQRYYTFQRSQLIKLDYKIKSETAQS